MDKPTGRPKGNQDREEQFAIEYCKCFNATLAGERVGLSTTSKGSLRVVSHRMLHRPSVQKMIKQILEDKVMDANEVIWRFAQEARLNVADFMTFRAEDGETIVKINWSNVKKYGFLIKSITPTKYGPKIEFNDAQKARELIGKHLGLWTDRLDVTSGGQSLDDTLNSLLDKVYGEVDDSESGDGDNSD